eukprot:CAMPEP_0181257672 /NCGR_PEP_ID=MMETSP1096-20121128/50371_1 /TAXON_ID=156174 ORGANISM="Chrysochromulina ericina, Strain CCMP281" /NCGR_SAMPLE_ID=MMETSP1096 /ASSEMBLY_ACC=CAM_ASM_000453 /LENGTH=85 /DNA_ID=CAMNT_0023356009 /DNA_START=225 /DNA_END=482 /DNA_ORIENTATION=+
MYQPRSLQDEGTHQDGEATKPRDRTEMECLVRAETIAVPTEIRPLKHVRNDPESETHTATQQPHPLCCCECGTERWVADYASPAL